jgi:hypothetical protein
MDRDAELAKIEDAERQRWLRQASRKHGERDSGPALRLNSGRRRFEQEGPISLGSGSIELRLLFCWVQANVRSDHLEAVLADFETARRRILDEESGRVQAAERWPVPDVLRPYVDERADETFDQRLQSLCQLAGCIEREARTLRESFAFAMDSLPDGRVFIRPRTLDEVRKAMTLRRGGTPAYASVEVWLFDARRKLRRLFGVPREEGA